MKINNCVPEKLDFKQLILRHFYEVTELKRKNRNINAVGTQAEKSRLALDFSIAAFTIIWK